MKYSVNDLIDHRIGKAKRSLEEAKLLAEKGYWNASANRLYYSSFYIVLALLAKQNIKTSTHSGVKTEFFRLYIKTGLFSKKYSHLYSDLLNKRQEGDYNDFYEFTDQDIKPLIPEIENFIMAIENFLRREDEIK